MRLLVKRHGRHYVYILQCADGTYYIGSTHDIESRIRRHNAGNGARYLRGKLPVHAVYIKEYRYYKNALRAERILKKLRRWQKEELVSIYARRNVQ